MTASVRLLVRAMNPKWKSRIVSRLRSKFISMGIWRTAGYVIFTVVLERVGFHLNYVFQRQMNCSGLPDFPAGFSARVARQMIDLSEQDRIGLIRYGGTSLMQGFHKAFALGRVCIIMHSPADELAAVCWAEKVDAFAPCTDAPCVLIARCFTLPQFRGMGLYPSVLSAVDHLIPDEMSCLGITVIECSAFNYPSRNGILKAGFHVCGMAVEIGRRRIAWRKKRT